MTVVVAIQLASPLPSVDSVTATLADFELRLQTQQSPSLTNVALAATSAPQPFRSSPSTGQGSRVPSFPSRRGCNVSTRGCGRSRSRVAPITGDSSSVYCYRCGYPNHKANVCEASPSAVSTAQAFTAFHIADQTDTAWYPDIGVSHHMTPDPSPETDVQSYSGSDTIIIDNGTGLSITSTASIPISPTVKLEKVLIVPDLQKNLLSFSKFTEEHQCCFIFYPWGFVVKDLQSRRILLTDPR